MILDKHILIKLNAKTIKYYEKLGYNIPRYLSQNKMVVKSGTTIKVLITDLPKRSRIKILCQCDKCQKINKVAYYSFHRRGSFDNYICKSCSTKNLNKSKKGVPLSKEHKEKMRNNSFLKGKFGKESPRWNNNITDNERIQGHHIPKITKWKTDIKKRDNNTCQKCGSIYKIHIHHINNFANFKEQRTDINNGIALCESCHKKIHKIFGKYTNRDNLNEFMKI